MDSDDNAPFTRRFLTACEQYPERPALIAGSRIYSYQELLACVKSVMHLVGETCQPTMRFGVVDQNDCHTYATFIALNLLGKTYVPINPRYPERRIAVILEEAQIDKILSSVDYPCPGCQVLQTGNVSEADDRPIVFPGVVSPEPAYILFTSGSTGKPKGVPIFNRQLNAFFAYFLDKQNYDFTPDDRFLQVYETSFDVSVFSAFSPLFVGASMYLLPRMGFISLEIPQLMALHQITVVSMVPSILHHLQPYFNQLKFEKLRYSFFSGDKLYHEIVEGWTITCPGAKIYNCYGPTEATIVCTDYLWRQPQSKIDSLHGVVPIGTLFPDMQYLLLDEDENEVSSGQAGEFCITGPQVIAGYLNHAGKEKFFTRLLNGKQMTFYRTGDLVLTNEQGTLLYLGRTDQQLKISGYRVEPGEIEFALSELNGHKLCAVVPVSQTGGMISLVAFMEGAGDEQAMLAELRRQLPPQCIPKQLVLLEKMPLNMNGKIDRKELLNLVP